MRTIKFRAWDRKNKVMLPLEDEDKEYVLVLNNGEVLENGKGEFYPSDKNIYLMQFTGLKDKNGKEIFDGDIVEFLGLKLPVGFMRGHFMVYMDFVGHEDLWKAIDRDPNLEVIGNIYENPELLIK